MDEKKPDAAKAEDVVLLHSPTEDGAGLRVLRAREGRVEAGVMRPLEEGKPIVQGEVVKLIPRHREGPDAPVVCDVEVQYAPPPAVHHGKPVQVASKAYRESWDRIFEGAAPESTAEADQRRLN